MVKQNILKGLRYSFFCLLLIVAIAINGIRFFLLSAEDYKTDLQNKVRELTELPIEIGSLRAHMRGFSPEFILDDIQVLATDSDKPAAIKLAQVRLRINLLQLLWTQDLLPSSALTLVGAELSIIRKEDGSLSIYGLSTDDADQPYWLLEGGRYEILNSHIIWLDEQRNAAPIIFKNVDLLLINDSAGQDHEIHFLAKLPEKYGKSLRVSMSIQGDVFAADNINGRVYIEAQDIVLSELISGEMPLNLNLQSGMGSFKSWSQFNKASLSTMIGSIQAENLILEKQQGKQQKLLHINELKTAFNVLNNDKGWGLTVADLLLKTDDQQWPSATFSLASDNAFNQIAASILQLDLEELTRLVQFFTPLDVSENSLVKKLDLMGMLKNVSLFIDNENSHYAVNGIFNNIFTRAFDGFPEINNLTGNIKGSDKSGSIIFNTDKGKVHFSKLFRKSLIIEQMKGEIKWLQTQEKWKITAENFILNTKDFQTETKVLVNIPKNEEPVFMDLQASFSNVQDISHASEYYPVSVMDEDVVDWLDNAFVSGKIPRGDVLVYGEMDKFPFVESQGVFEVLYRMEDVELQYNSDWPNLNKVSAEVLFLENSVTIDMSHAYVDGLTIKHALLEIPSFATSDHLLVKGKIEGKLIDGLHFLQKTPLSTTANSVLAAITPKGLTQVHLDLNIPLADNAEVEANVIAHLSKASLKVNSIDLDISGISGDLRFTEIGLFSKNINARTLGFPLLMNAYSNTAKTIININGSTDIRHLKQQFDFFDSWILKDQRLKGSTAYQLKLDLPANINQTATLAISSGLAGISVDFPEILHKTAKEKSSLLVLMDLNDKQILPLSLHYHDDLKIAMGINKQNNEIHSAHIVYGKGKATAPLEPVIKIEIERDKFDLAQWLPFIGQAQTEANQANPVLNNIHLLTKQLQWQEQAYGSFELAMHRLNGQWLGTMASSMAKGAFSLPKKQAENEAIELNLQYLNLTELLKIDFQQDNFTAQKLPLIQVISEQLWWKDTNLGSLKVETERINDGMGFKHIDVISDQHKIELKADWVKNAGVNTTYMVGSVTTNDFGDFLSQFEFENDFKESKGKIDIDAQWLGSPYQFSIATVEAEIDVHLKDGRLVNVEPGFGRVLGLIAMEQWFKRLTLDFGDLYKKGMSLNSITGHFLMAEGKVLTSDLLVDAVPAQIFIAGKTNLLDNTLDYSMGVVPKSSGALPIAGTIVNSIAGVITQVFTDDYKEGFFFGSQYKVEGQWDNIQILPVHEQDGILKKTWTGLTDFSWMRPATKQSNKNNYTR